jgi:hypothetical protein
LGILNKYLLSVKRLHSERLSERERERENNSDQESEGGLLTSQKDVKLKACLANRTRVSVIQPGIHAMQMKRVKARRPDHAFT